ncbi:Citrate transporter [[Clostridium] symbiosum]|uniref:Citrate transporter n=2 Tax=Clostridium symbiosum TaxID=1512 RepID=A0A6N3BER4_CLOSY|nr:citrate:proton symporter [[Clostridium] symbiosum]MDM8136395.1 citrate:proton symporter [[Clostridium] symbiosum]MDM8139214.1 citrate:proton symporter [[Clostridium] symbiosum]MDM8317823.1 citrate:proton symporter [[Clostridium] symbiosum]
MSLAFLGFAMIVVFMALIMAKKLSPFTSLILVPIAFGLLAGYGWDTLKYAMNGIKSVASTFSMMTFAILYFGVMLTAGMFDPMVDKVVAWCKGDPLKVLVGTAVLAAFVSLDGDGTTTVMICCTAMIPIYNRLKIKKIYLANLIILQNCIMNLIPWGGPTARVMSVMNLDAGELLAPLVPGMALSAVYVIGVSYYLGLKERKRLGIMDISNSVNTVELSDEEREWKRPKMILFNLLLTVAIITSLIMGLASSAILFGVGTAIALVVNYPVQKTQRKVISSLAPDMISVVMMVLGAGVLMGVLNGPEDAGMSNAIAQFLVSVIPESLGRYFAVIIAVISAPGTYLLNNDAFYYGVLPPLAATAQAYGFTDLQIGFAALMGQAFHFLSPLVPFIYLLMDLTEISLAEYQGYIFKWCIGIFVIFMGAGLLLGYLPVL